MTGPVAPQIRLFADWPPQIGQSKDSGAVGYASFRFEHAQGEGDAYDLQALDFSPAAVCCANGHPPEPVLYGASERGPWLCSACHTGATPPATLAEMVAAAAAQGVPAPGSTPPVRGVREAVLVTVATAYDANTLGDANPALWADELVLARIIAAEQRGHLPERALVLIYAYPAQTWEKTPGFVTWWPGAEVACVQWVDTTWWYEDTPSLLNCVARFNQTAAP